MITKTTSFKSALLRQFLVVIVWVASIFLFAASTSAHIKPPSVVPQIKEVESSQKGVSQSYWMNMRNIVARNKPKGGNRYVYGEFSIDDYKTPGNDIQTNE
jgi:hypothetical protein